jgi:hypothetical protein
MSNQIYKKYPKFHILDVVKSKIYNIVGQVEFIEFDQAGDARYYFLSEEDGQKYLNSSLEQNLSLIQSYPEQKFPIGADVIIEIFGLYKGLNGKILNYNEIYQEYKISVIGEDFELILLEKNLRSPTEKEMEQISICGILN